VKDAFASRPYIAAIEVIPTTYLRAGGGFDNLQQAARMHNVDVVTLLSYDQVQFSDSNRLSIFYWTIVGGYFVNGSQYDVNTLVDASVFDVKSRQLLFRAPAPARSRAARRW
jgi:rhombotail lipoprotein